MDHLVYIVAVAGMVGSGLIAGAFLAFSSFIMSALARMPDAQGARAMQHINVTVFTPWFMGPFMGTAALSVGVVVLALLNTDEAWWLPLALAGALYAAGVFVLTAAGNVPLNNRLAAMDASEPEAAAFWRETYLVVWTRWNHVRTAASTLAMIQFGVVLSLL